MKEGVKFAVALIIMIVLNASAQQKKSAAPPLIDPDSNCHLRYFYFPNLEAYYDTQKSIYLYMEGGVWKSAKELPNGYRGYSLNNKVNVLIKDYDDDNPCQFLPIHKKKYPYNNGRNKRMTASID